MKKNCLFLCLFFLRVCSLAQIQSLSFINFNEHWGLSDRFIYAACQDNAGYMWFGTGTGLYRFDGQEFKHFYSNVDLPGHQIGNILQHIYCDFDGQLWLASLNALQKYNPKTNRFIAFDYQLADIKKLIVEHKVQCFFRDSRGSFWIGTNNNFCCQFDEKKQMTQFNFTNKLGKNNLAKNVFSILEIPQSKNLWVITAAGIVTFDNKKNELTLFAEGVKNNEFTCGYFDKQKKCFWLGVSNKGIAKFDLEHQQYEFFVNPNKEHVFSIISKNENEIWVGGNENLLVFNIATKKYSAASSETNDDYSFKTKKIGSFFKDKENNLWLCSYFGLSELPWQNNQVYNIELLHPTKEFSIEPNGVCELKNNNFLIANNNSNGLLYWDGKKKEISELKKQNLKNEKDYTNGINCIHKTKNGDIFCGDKDGLYTFDTNTLSIKKLIVKDQDSKQISEVNKIISDKAGNLYLYAANNGYYFYNTKANKAQHYNISDIEKGKRNIPNNIIPALIDSKENVWFVGVQGVYFLNKASGQYSHFAYQKNTNNEEYISQSFDIAEDKNGHFWITTLDNGIYELSIDNGKKQLKNYNGNSKVGLPSDYCQNIICDDGGFLWIGTLMGLVKFDPFQKKTVSIFTKQNGLTKANIDVPLNYLPSGKLVINHYSSLDLIDLKSYQWNNYALKISLNSLKVFDQELLQNADTFEVNLKHNQNYLRLQLAALGYNNSNNNQIYYQLSGVDKDWEKAGTNEIVYSNLPAGEYTFGAKAYNNDGLQSNNQLLILINIASPFWKKWWFFISLILIIGALIYSLYRYRLQQIKKQEQIKTEFNKQIANIEMKALRAQMNPHFIFNSLNSIQKFILKNNSFEASQYLSKFSKLIRLILDHSKQQYISLSSEIEMLQLYLEIESLRFDNSFTYTVDIDTQLSTEGIQIPSMLIQPYLENAIWHGLMHKESDRKLSLTIKEIEPLILTIIIEDNGIGRAQAMALKSKQSTKKKSYGMQITEDRIGILNQIELQKTSVTVTDLKNLNNIACGTRVTVNIPFKAL
jgi:ligand-binding sensor domain-containing protein/uncharacterized membrane-anchored protein YhcB (DUF1043 family)